jgi:hypothetical protein
VVRVAPPHTSRRACVYQERLPEALYPSNTTGRWLVVNTEISARGTYGGIVVVHKTVEMLDALVAAGVPRKRSST